LTATTNRENYLLIPVHPSDLNFSDSASQVTALFAEVGFIRKMTGQGRVMAEDRILHHRLS